MHLCHPARAHKQKNLFNRPLALLLFVTLALAFANTFRSCLSLLASHLSLRPLNSSIVATMPYQEELKVAELAVQRATILTKKVFHEKAKGTLSKDDKSPVTIGDFGAQALIIQAIKKNFPEDAIVGEEEASSLREQKALSSQIWELVKEVKLDDP